MREAPASTDAFADRPPIRRTPLDGLLMGLADSVPGVSGGTVALILGIHPRLVAAIAAIDVSIARALVSGKQRARDAWRHADLGFLVLLALGIATGIGVGATILSVVLERWPAALMAVLLGLVLASLHHPARVPEWNGRDWVLAVGVGLVALGIGVIPGIVAPQALWFLPLAGAIAACAMILPGISGAYLLVLMGLYEPIIHAVAELDFVVVGLVGVGALVGILAFSRGLRHLLNHHSGPTHAAMVGLLAGSLVRLWPWRSVHGFAQGAPVVPDALLPALFVAVGVGAGMLVSRLGKRPPARAPPEPASR